MTFEQSGKIQNRQKNDGKDAKTWLSPQTKLDPITQTLFQSIMQKIKKKQTIPSSMRNSLLLDLYHNYSFDSH